MRRCLAAVSFRAFASLPTLAVIHLVIFSVPYFIFSANAAPSCCVLIFQKGFAGTLIFLSAFGAFPKTTFTKLPEQNPKNHTDCPRDAFLKRGLRFKHFSFGPDRMSLCAFLTRHDDVKAELC